MAAHRSRRRNAQLLIADARNRAIRTFLQGLAIDLAVAIATTVYAVVNDPKPIVWAVVAASVGRSVLQSAASYVMRRFVDSSPIPTPLPPDPPGEPDNDVRDGRDEDGAIRLVSLVAGAVGVGVGALLGLLTFF